MLKIFKNSFSLLLAKGVNPLLSSLLVIFLARRFGPEELGIYSLVLNWFVVFEIIASLGLRPLLIRKISQRPTHWRRYFSAAVYVGGVSAAVFAVVLGGSALLFTEGRAIQYGLLIMAGLLVPSVFYYVVESVLYAQEQMAPPALMSVADSVMKTALAVAALWITGEILWVFAAVFVARSVVSGVLYRVLRRRVGLVELKLEGRVAWPLFRSTLTFAAITIVAATFWRLDILMLSAMMDETAVGVYSSAYRFFALAMLISEAFTTALFPTLSRLRTDAPAQFRRTCAAAAKWLTISLLPLSVLLWFLTEPLIGLIYGVRFAEAVPVLRLLILALVPLALSQVLARALLASGRQRTDLQINLLGLLVNVGLNATLIGQYGLAGAASATVAVTYLNLGVLLLALRRELKMVEYTRGAGRLGLSGLVLLGVAALMNGVSMPVKLILPVLGFYGTLILTGAIGPGERAWLRRLATRPREVLLATVKS